MEDAERVSGGVWRDSDPWEIADGPDDLECVDALVHDKLLMSYASGFYMGFGGTGVYLMYFRSWPESNR